VGPVGRVGGAGVDEKAGGKKRERGGGGHAKFNA